MPKVPMSRIKKLFKRWTYQLRSCSYWLGQVENVCGDALLWCWWVETGRPTDRPSCDLARDTLSMTEIGIIRNVVHTTNRPQQLLAAHRRWHRRQIPTKVVWKCRSTVSLHGMQKRLDAALRVVRVVCPTVGWGFPVTSGQIMYFLHQ
jgi:hypothetical protein